MKKVVRIGSTKNVGSVFCSIKYVGGRLSIVGVEGPMRNGNARGGFGQIDVTQNDYIQYAPGWDAELVSKFAQVWERWHLNDMRAGTPAQMQFLRENPVDAKYPESYYDVASAALKAAGLNPDNGYEFGSAWLKEEVPAEVLEFLASLPDSDDTPPWV